MKRCKSIRLYNVLFPIWFLMYLYPSWLPLAVLGLFTERLVAPHLGNVFVIIAVTVPVFGLFAVFVSVFGIVDIRGFFSMFLPSPRRRV